jgi:hypothetical protein
MVKRVVVLADPGQSDVSKVRSGENGDWPRVKNYQLPAKYEDAPNPARVCFWREIRFRNASRFSTDIATPEVYSIAEFPRSDEIFKDTALLIVSWDAANGDQIYRGDDTLAYLATRGRVPIERFLDAGGVLLIESQTAQSRPLQRSYDAIFNIREVEVSSGPKDELAAGTEALILEGARSHPLVEIFPDKENITVESTVSDESDIFVNVPEEIVARSGYIGLHGSNGNISKKLWFGWFTKWTVEWMPLFYVRIGNSERYPVLLTKAHGRGLIILTTMWLSVAQHPLSSRIAEVALSHELLTAAIKVQGRARLKRRIVDCLVATTVLVVLLVAAFGVVAVARRADQNWILATLGIGVIGLANGAWRVVKAAYDRPLSVPAFKLYGFKKRLIGRRR